MGHGGIGYAGGIEELPNVLMESYEDVPTPKNQVKIRMLFVAKRAAIVSHFGEDFTRILAAKLGIDE